VALSIFSSAFLDIPEPLDDNENTEKFLNDIKSMQTATFNNVAL
jgi:hypothetical protein